MNARDRIPFCVHLRFATLVLKSFDKPVVLGGPVFWMELY